MWEIVHRYKGRQVWIRLKEHQKDVEKTADKKYTRATRKASTSEQHESAITDCVAQANHIINLGKAKYSTGRLTHSLQKGAMAINRNEGIFTLDHVFDLLLTTTFQPGRATTIIGTTFYGKSSEPKHLWSSHKTRWQKLKRVSKILDLSNQIFIYLRLALGYTCRNIADPCIK